MQRRPLRLDIGLAFGVRSLSRMKWIFEQAIAIAYEGVRLRLWDDWNRSPFYWCFTRAFPIGRSCCKMRTYGFLLVRFYLNRPWNGRVIGATSCGDLKCGVLRPNCIRRRLSARISIRLLTSKVCSQSVGVFMTRNGCYVVKQRVSAWCCLRVLRPNPRDAFCVNTRIS